MNNFFLEKYNTQLQDALWNTTMEFLQENFHEEENVQDIINLFMSAYSSTLVNLMIMLGEDVPEIKPFVEIFKIKLLDFITSLPGFKSIDISKADEKREAL